MSGVTVTCDRCAHQFSPEVKDSPQRGGGLLRWFRCPQCRDKYLVARFSARGVQLMQDIRGAEAQIAQAPDSVELRQRLWTLRKALEPEVTKP